MFFLHSSKSLIPQRTTVRVSWLEYKVGIVRTLTHTFVDCCTDWHRELLRQMLSTRTQSMSLVRKMRRGQDVFQPFVVLTSSIVSFLNNRKNEDPAGVRCCCCTHINTHTNTLRPRIPTNGHGDKGGLGTKQARNLLQER